MKNLIGSGKTLWDFCVEGSVIIFDDDQFPPLEKCKSKIIVSHIPSPDIVLYMSNALAIITETGGALCHAAVLALEMGCPIIVSAEGIAEKLKDNQKILLISTEREGKIYEI